MNADSRSAESANWLLRRARLDDVTALEELIPLSARLLQVANYSAAQIEAALGPVLGVDRQLLQDGTYWVVEHNGMMVACGGWSQSRSLYGGDSGRPAEDSMLDPVREAARVRACFVHPAWARRGIGRCLMTACELAIATAGVRAVEIVATLTDETLYAAFGYEVVERFEVPLSGGPGLPVVRMNKSLPTRAMVTQARVTS